MADWGIKVSLPGYDVKTATPEQMSIHSGYPSPKIDSRSSPAHFGTSTYTFSSEPAAGAVIDLVTVAHGYGYTPAAISYMKDLASGNFYFLPLFFNPAGSDQRIVYFTDGTNFKAQYRGETLGLPHQPVNGTSWTFKYYIFSENGA